MDKNDQHSKIHLPCNFEVNLNPKTAILPLCSIYRHGGHDGWSVKGIPLRMIQAKFGLNWPSGFRGEDFFRNRPISIKNCLWRPCLLRIELKWTIFIEDLPYMLVSTTPPKRLIGFK
jgi:hypothetical protein